MAAFDRVLGIAGLRGVIAHRPLGSGGAVVGVVIVDAEGVAAEQGDIVRLAGMHLGVEVGGVAVALGEFGDVRRGLGIEYLAVVLVLLEDDEDVLVARHAFQARACGLGDHRGEQRRPHGQGRQSATA